MKNPRLIIAIAVTVVVVLIGAIVAIAVTGDTSEPEHSTAPAEATSPPHAPVPPIEGDDHDHGEDGHGDEDHQSSGISDSGEEEMYAEAEAAALAWVEYDSAEPVEDRAARLSEWFPESHAELEPILTRPEFKRKYNPNESSRIEAKGVAASTQGVPSEEQFDDGYLLFLVDVDFHAYWALESEHGAACNGTIGLKILLPYTVDDARGIVLDTTRPFDVIEPEEHTCVRT
ncbi:MAG: hypothetical protein ACTH0V_00235 [Microbacteriaceae bacterium]